MIDAEVKDLSWWERHFAADGASEHFADLDHKARRFLQHCKHLFVLVPFRELREGLASRIDVSVFACPGAWGWSAPEHALQLCKNLIRIALGRRWVQAPYQALHAIDAVSASRP